MRITWEQVTDIVKRDAPSYAGFDTFVGVNRGGVIIASLFQRFHPNTKLAMVDAGCTLNVVDNDVLIIDDIWDTGQTLETLHSKAFQREGNLACYTLTSKQLVTPIYHSYGLVVPNDVWVVFPWEIEEKNHEG